MTTPWKCYNKCVTSGMPQSGPSSARQSRVSQAVVCPVEEMKIVSDLNNFGNCDGDAPLVRILAKAQGHVQLSFLCSRTKTTATSIAA